MLNYTTIEKVEKFLTIDIDAAQEPFVLNYIAAMSRHADDYCNRTLMVENSETRKFSGIGSQTLHIDEACEITSVTPKDGDAMDLSNILNYPLNRNYILALYNENGVFERGNANYSVEGYFGHIKAGTVTDSYPDNVPDKLETAVTMLVGIIVNLSRTGGDTVKSEKIGMYSYTAKDLQEQQDYKIAMQLLDEYRRLAL